MAYLYRKNRSPYWYIQYIDSERIKHDKSTGLRADDPNDTAKAKTLRAELEANEHRKIPLVNGAAWDIWVPKFLDRHCQTEPTLERYQDAWKWLAMWLQRARIHAPRQLTYRRGVEYVDWRTNFKKRTGKRVGRNTAIFELKTLSLIVGEAVRLGHADAVRSVYAEVLGLTATTDDAGDAIADGEAVRTLVGPFTERVDDACELETGDVGGRAGRGRVAAGSLEQVGAVEARSVHPHAHLARARFEHRTLFDRDGAVAGRADCADGLDPRAFSTAGRRAGGASRARPSTPPAR